MRRRATGIFILEAMVGAALLALMGAMLLAAVQYQQRLGIQLDRRRELARQAERALVRLQEGMEVDEQDGPPTIDIEMTALETPGIDEHRWVRVRASRASHQAELVGLAPTNVLQEQGFLP